MTSHASLTRPAAQQSPSPRQQALSVGQASHPLERAADRMAQGAIGGRVAGTDVDYDDAPHAVAPPVVHAVLRSAGQPLDASTRSRFEARFS